MPSRAGVQGAACQDASPKPPPCQQEILALGRDRGSAGTLSWRPPSAPPLRLNNSNCPAAALRPPHSFAVYCDLTLGPLRDFLCEKSGSMGAKAAFLIRLADLGAAGAGGWAGAAPGRPQQGRLTSFHTQLPLWPNSQGCGPCWAAATHPGPLGGRPPAPRTGGGRVAPDRGPGRTRTGCAFRFLKSHADGPPAACSVFTGPRPARPPRGLGVRLRSASTSEQPLRAAVSRADGSRPRDSPGSTARPRGR